MRCPKCGKEYGNLLVKACRFYCFGVRGRLVAAPIHHCNKTTRDVAHKLRNCADSIALVDDRMQQTYRKLERVGNAPSPQE